MASNNKLGCALLLSGLCLAVRISPAATIVRESFETPGTNDRYTVIGDHQGGNNSYFRRDVVSAFAERMDECTGEDGSYIYAGEDTDTLAGPPGGVCSVTLNPVTVRPYGNIRITIAVAAPTLRSVNPPGTGRYESEDYMEIDYRYDGGIWQKIGAFRGEDVDHTFREDTNLDGIGDGIMLQDAFRDFTYTPSGSGTNMQVRVRFRTNSNDEEAGFDNIRITGDPLPPAITITNPPADINVNDSVVSYNIGGTAGRGCVGLIAWTNSLTGEGGTFPAADTWSVNNVGLQAGINVITVKATNLTGATASDTVRINQVIKPALSITEPAGDIAVNNSVTDYDLAGTANPVVVGTISWTNELSGAAGTVAAAANWSIVDVPLVPGLNVITVSGTNIVNETASDSVTINHVIPPTVDITDPSGNIVVESSAGTYDLAGNANYVVAGNISWSNRLTGLTGTAPVSTEWSIDGMALDTGVNLITVTVSNIVGETASDSVEITRAAAPALAITSPPGDIAVSSGVTDYDLAGTANAAVVGNLAWTNELTGASGAVAASPAWSIENVALAAGVNRITVKGENIAGEAASDTVEINQVVPPAVQITAPPGNIAVGNTVSNYTVSGTANSVSVGNLTWTNSLTGGSGTVAAGTTWSVPDIPLTGGINRITVTVSNIVGESASDWVEINQVANPPELTITSPPRDIAVSNSITSYDISGTAYNVQGNLSWSNELTGAGGTLAATTNWSITGIELGQGINRIIVSGTNVLSQSTLDSVDINRVVPPALAITVPPGDIAVSTAVTDYDIRGTANYTAVGSLRWTNSLTGESGAAPAATSWTIADVPLSAGINVITVFATNLVNETASASVSINQVVPPAVAITLPSGNIAVDDGVTSAFVGGTANQAVAGIAWTNALTGESGSIAPAANWLTVPTPVPLGIGRNLITVIATNIVGESASDSVEINRVVAPELDITAPPGDIAVSTAVGSFDLAGTANDVVVGNLLWTNSLTGGSGSAPAGTSWSIAGVPLADGVNMITVTGTNVLAESVSRSVEINRVIPPAVDITQPAGNIAVNDQTTNYVLQGTINHVVAGNLSWTNSLTGDSGVIAAGSPWTIAGIALARGVNRITITGTNIVNQAASDAVEIYRVMPPAISITNPPASIIVGSSVTNITVSGTANEVVTGYLAWTNSLTGDSGASPAATNWTIADIPLADGLNIITITGTNILGQSAADSVNIHQDDNPPALSIIFPADTVIVGSRTECHLVFGNANAAVIGNITWTNSLTGESGAVPAGLFWTIPEVPLGRGLNRITVSGTNDSLLVVSDSVDIRQVDPTAVAITIPAGNMRVDSTVTSVFVAGTVDENTAVGDLVWRNRLTGQTGRMPASSPWAIPAVALAPGVNRISVTASNIAGEAAVDSVNIEHVIDPVLSLLYPTGDIVVGADKTHHSVIGTANNVTTGVLTWNNILTGGSGTVAAAPYWIVADIPLAPGVNPITVSGSNIVGRTGSVLVRITRLESGSAPQLVGIALQEDGALDRYVISWTSESNRLYDVLASTNLLESFVPIETGLPATPPMNTYTDWFEGHRRFYLIGEEH